MASTNTRPLTKLFRVGFEYAISKPQKIASFIWRIVRSPSKFAREYVSDDKDHRLAAALKFYFSIFVFAFGLSVFGSQFQLYEGKSELRDLIRLILQVAVGIPVIYLLLLVMRYRVKFLGLLQMVLYIDGVYLLALSAVSILISYFDHLMRIPTTAQALDIFATELERCLSRESLIYWAIRGDLQFHLYNDLWRPNDWIKWVVENHNYPLVVPFLFVFAWMVKAKYGGNFVVIVLAAGFGYTASVVSVERAEAAILANRVKETPRCYHATLDEITRKYSVTLIAQQLEYKLSNELRKILQSKATVSPVFGRMDEVFVFAVGVERAPDVEWVAQSDREFKSTYCSVNVYWEMMRRIRYPLIVLVYDANKKPFYYRRFDPQVCMRSD